MLGVSLLNEIVPNREFRQANQFLEEMRKEFKANLRQREGFRARKEGIDISLCIVDPQKKKIQYAGAYNPLFIVQNGVLREIKAVPNPIGVHRQELSFENHVIEISPNDQLYLFSDGFIDQLGGPYGHKFMKKKFKQLLADNYNKPMAEQKNILQKEFEAWRNGMKQVDDILVIGLRL